VVTVGALITMAAHLEGKSASVLDFMGFAQKGGSVLSFVRLADVPSRLNQVRIDTQQADAILACDLVVGASADALARCATAARASWPTRTKCRWPRACAIPDASLKVPQLLEKLRFAAGADRLETLDAQALAEAFLGDSIVSNILALGYAWQRGLVPVSARRCCAHRAQWRRRGQQQAGVLAGPPGRRRPAGGHGAAARDGSRKPPRPKRSRRWCARRRSTSPATRTRLCAPLRRFVARVRVREASLGADPSLPFTRAVAAAC
jgi:indolepyruvate ferredoxin oxidoreductase